MNKQLNPPIAIANVEVLGFDDKARTLQAVFNVYEDAQPLPDVQTAKEMMRKIIRYMEIEGFFSPGMTWKINAGIVLHPKK